MHVLPMSSRRSTSAALWTLPRLHSLSLSLALFLSYLHSLPVSFPLSLSLNLDLSHPRLTRPSLSPLADNLDKVGVGIIFRKDAYGLFHVLTLTKGGPAQQSNVIEVGDVIMEINGRQVPPWDAPTRPPHGTESLYHPPSPLHHSPVVKASRREPLPQHTPSESLSAEAPSPSCRLSA